MNSSNMHWFHSVCVATEDQTQGLTAQPYLRPLHSQWVWWLYFWQILNNGESGGIQSIFIQKEDRNRLSTNGTKILGPNCYYKDVLLTQCPNLLNLLFSLCDWQYWTRNADLNLLGETLINRSYRIRACGKIHLISSPDETFLMELV